MVTGSQLGNWSSSLRPSCCRWGTHRSERTALSQVAGCVSCSAGTHIHSGAFVPHPTFCLMCVISTVLFSYLNNGHFPWQQGAVSLLLTDLLPVSSTESEMYLVIRSIFVECIFQNSWILCLIHFLYFFKGIRLRGGGETGRWLRYTPEKIRWPGWAMRNPAQSNRHWDRLSCGDCRSSRQLGFKFKFCGLQATQWSQSS